MKKTFTLSSFILSLLLVVSATVNAQNIYWGAGQGFENQNGGNINSSSSLAPTTPTVDTADGGTVWTLFEAYRTASNPATCTGYGAGHIRLLKVTGSPWVATPDLAFGVNTISFLSASTTVGKVFTLQYTTGQYSDQDAAGVAGATWTTFTKFKLLNCDDTTVTLNLPTARRIRFINDTAIAYQDDIDSILITSTSPIVPVNFTGISANYNSGIVKVLWSNQAEINLANYQIERSVDGKNFTSIGTVKATGVKNYTWYDNAPVPGNSFYRIKAIDASSTFTYSRIISVNSTSSIQGIVVAPNPVRGKNLSIQLTNLTRGNYSVNIFNNSGQKVFSNTVYHPGGNSLQTFSLPVSKGVYNVNVTNGSVSFNKNIIVE